MSDYIISSESIMDLSADYVKELGVSFIKSNYELNGEIYLDDFGQSLDMEEFYRNMEEGAAPSTAAINTQAYLDYFEEILKKIWILSMFVYLRVLPPNTLVLFKQLIYSRRNIPKERSIL